MWDALNALDAVQRFTSGKTFEDYLAEELLQSGVERQLAIVGEALSQLAHLNPEVAGRIPELRRVVAFRNVLIHGYQAIDHERVWTVVTRDAAPLAAALRATLEGAT